MTLDDVKLNLIGLHPAFPQQVWVIVEQPRGDPYRWSYDPGDQCFARTTHRSLLYDREFSGVYGWIGGTGTPPEPHYDILLFTEQDLQPGAVVAGYICGVFLRRDGDHKFVAVDAERRGLLEAADLSALDPVSYQELLRLYPGISAGEGWFAADIAYGYLQNHRPVGD